MCSGSIATNDCIYAIGTVRNIMQDTFRYFIRKNFPEIGSELSNKDIDEIGVEFHIDTAETHWSRSADGRKAVTPLVK